MTKHCLFIAPDCKYLQRDNAIKLLEQLPDDAKLISMNNGVMAFETNFYGEVSKNFSVREKTTITIEEARGKIQ